MMNRTTAKAAISSLTAKLFQLHAALFHSTPILNRRRNNFWNDFRPSKSNYSSRRSRKMSAKHALLRNLNVYADYIFHGWRDEEEDFTSWFRDQFKGKSRRSTKNNGHKGTYVLSDDEFEWEKRSRSQSDRKSKDYWSFINEDDDDVRHKARSHNADGAWWRHKVEDEYHYSSGIDCKGSSLVSERLALGLNAYGPLKIEDVKNAYRACALKWHPDRHNGSFKAVAEEKFKVCGTAYRSLCDELGST